MALLLAVAPAAFASTTWYVNGVTGSDSNDCKSPTTACKTIGHAISLSSSGDSVMVAAATYKENLTISNDLNVIGSGAKTTIIDGGGAGIVVTIPNTSTHVTLSKLTIQNGLASGGSGFPGGGGINNQGTLTIQNSTISGNSAIATLCEGHCGINGGGILTFGTLTISGSTISGNGSIIESCQGIFSTCTANGGGIASIGSFPLTVTNSSINGNFARAPGVSHGGGIYGGVEVISNSTISGNSVTGSQAFGGGIYTFATLQNSIVANNTGGNCFTSITSNGYNLSSDSTCNFNNTGDLNNTDPKLGPLQNNGGPTQTQALLSGSPAIDAGNPNGCTDGQGHLLKTDQRGMPRPDQEDTGGCDMGAYERQSD
jgi:hypothetical protein